MSSANIHVEADDVGDARAWISDEITLWRVGLTGRGYGGTIAIAGKIDAARALRDALTSVIEQAEALSGGPS